MEVVENGAMVVGGGCIGAIGVVKKDTHPWRRGVDLVGILWVEVEVVGGIVEVVDEMDEMDEIGNAHLLHHARTLVRNIVVVGVENALDGCNRPGVGSNGVVVGVVVVVVDIFDRTWVHHRQATRKGGLVDVQTAFAWSRDYLFDHYCATCLSFYPLGYVPDWNANHFHCRCRLTLYVLWTRVLLASHNHFQKSNSWPNSTPHLLRCPTQKNTHPNGRNLEWLKIVRTFCI